MNNSPQYYKEDVTRMKKRIETVVMKEGRHSRL